jgi:hypothetical protein
MLAKLDPAEREELWANLISRWSGMSGCDGHTFAILNARIERKMTAPAIQAPGGAG